MAVKPVNPKSWTSWVRASDGYLRSDDPYGTYGGYTPALPQATVTTTYSLPTGNIWTASNTSVASVAGDGATVRDNCTLNYALTNCSLNDVIVLAAGATYTGTYTIPNKVSGSGWVYVISSSLASLPAAGTRVGTGDAANMPLMVAPSATAATIISTTSSHHFRFVGIEIKSASTNVSPLQGSVVNLGNSDVSNSTVCDNIIFDRCYVHGSAATTNSGRRGFFLAGTNLAVIDSYVSGFYDDGSDSQAIFVYQGNGPFKIHNNYLEGASENVIFGGTDPTISNSVPSDITITHNTFSKPLGWVAASHNVKNLLEFKNAQRVLVEGNVFTNNWAQGQNGYAILITPRNQSGGASWCVTKDITIRKNKMYNVAGGFNIAGDDSNFTSQRTYRVLVENNLIQIADPSTGGIDRAFQVVRGPRYVTIRHNTVLGQGNAYAYAENATVPGGSVIGDGFKFTDNILTNGTYGMTGNGTSTPDNVVPAEFINYTFNKNVAIGGTSTDGDGLGTYYVPANNAAVLFTDISGAFEANNYTLQAGSAYHNAATDGTDIGCDIAAMAAAIA